jgi:hypothetical protein
LAQKEPVVLFFGANPVNTEPLRIGKEFMVIAKAVEEGSGETKVKLRPSFAVGAGQISAEDRVTTAFNAGWN